MKIVNESIYSFEKKLNPLDSLNVGRKVLITKWLDEMEIIGYTINNDLTIDVDNGVGLDDIDIKEFPEYIQFNKVSYYFSASYCNLISLKGFPKFVSGSFWINNNNLTSLTYSPKFVGGIFDCQKNAIQFTEEDVKNQCEVIMDIIL
jgi:hypothetical protein